MPGPKQSLAQFGQTIKAKHPEYGDMKDEDVASKVLAKYPEYGDMVDTNASSSPANPTLGQYLGNVGTGALRGMASTISGLDDFATKHLPAFMTTPIGQTPNAENSARATAYAKQLGTPKNDMQAFGKGIEQGAEFLAPGAAEEKLATKLAPVVGRGAAKIGLAAAGAGAVNKLQGGSVGAGMLAGGVGAGIGAGIKAVTPTLAESAMRVTGNDRMYGRSVGQAILDDTKGITPQAVEDSARKTLRLLAPQLAGVANDASVAGSRGSLAPARAVVDNSIASNFGNRATKTAAELEPVKNFLQTDAVTNLPLAESQTPTGLLRLKRGLDADFIGNWNPNTNSRASLDAAKSAYGQLADQFHASAPGAAKLDQRISSLIPVTDRASRVARGAGITENVINKMRAPTGALAGALGGGYAGYERGGVGGAVTGGLIGGIAPAVISSPESLMALARGANSTVLPTLNPFAVGGGLQLSRGLRYKDPSNK